MYHGVVLLCTVNAGVQIDITFVRTNVRALQGLVVAGGTVPKLSVEGRKWVFFRNNQVT